MAPGHRPGCPTEAPPRAGLRARCTIACVAVATVGLGLLLVQAVVRPTNDMAVAGWFSPPDRHAGELPQAQLRLPVQLPRRYVEYKRSLSNLKCESACCTQPQHEAALLPNPVSLSQMTRSCLGGNRRPLPPRPRTALTARPAGSPTRRISFTCPAAHIPCESLGEVKTLRGPSRGLRVGAPSPSSLGSANAAVSCPQPSPSPCATGTPYVRRPSESNLKIA